MYKIIAIIEPTINIAVLTFIPRSNALDTIDINTKKFIIPKKTSAIWFDFFVSIVNPPIYYFIIFYNDEVAYRKLCPAKPEAAMDGCSPDKFANWLILHIGYNI
jgi:hypothetical protein